MNDELYENVRNNSKFHVLVKKRSKLTKILSLVIFIVYFSYILLIAFKSEILNTFIGDSYITIAMPFGLFIIILCFLLTGIYTKKANSEFDTLISQIKDEVKE